MDLEHILRTTLVMLGEMHVLGRETAMFEACKRNVKTAADTIRDMKKEAQHDQNRNREGGIPGEIHPADKAE